ncbi:TPA: site-specific integrase [Stenotrophomonas maltophilia]|nr:site-specific integrase [Stenotrophomonas maltophilia]
MLEGSSLARSSLTKKLRQIESLYAHTDLVFGQSFLDDALGTVNDALLSDMLESWFISIKNQSDIGPSDEARWRAGLSFVVCIITRLSKANLPTERLRRMEARLHRLSHLYGQLHVQRNRRPSFPRSLPASVVHALYEILDPSSTTNPFARQRTRWLAFLAFVLMLHQGLRRGEVLLLTADAVKDGFDERQRRLRFWLNVRESKYASDDDPRHSKPSIKSPNSVRQLPVSDTISSMVQAYVENYRGKPNHPFLLNTQQNTPLSTESMTKMFAKVSASLPKSVRQELMDRNGKAVVTPHDLRHTCAVIRLNQLITQGDAMDEALQKLRSFFGWSRDSQMPVHYARAVFEDRMSSVWNSAFDERVEVLRALNF